MKFNYKKLKQARRDNHLTIYRCSHELSKAGIDISHQTLLNWEKGKGAPNCHKLADLVTFFGKTLSFFFDENKKKGRKTRQKADRLT